MYMYMFSPLTHSILFPCFPANMLMSSAYLILFNFENFEIFLNEDWRKDRSELYGLDQQLSSVRSGRLVPRARWVKLLTQSSFGVEWIIKVMVRYLESHALTLIGMLVIKNEKSYHVFLFSSRYIVFVSFLLLPYVHFLQQNCFLCDNYHKILRRRDRIMYLGKTFFG